MFTQADFNRAFRIICVARVSTRRRGHRTGYLIRWASGDVAWGTDAEIAWPEQARVVNFFHVDTGVPFYERLPQCSLEGAQ